jgi:hypothetical protein
MKCKINCLLVPVHHVCGPWHSEVDLYVHQYMFKKGPLIELGVSFKYIAACYKINMTTKLS